MPSTDYLRLSEHKIFKNVRETLPKDIKRTKNVMALADDMLYTWDFQDNCVLALNVKAARSRDGDNIKHQFDVNLYQGQNNKYKLLPFSKKSVSGKQIMDDNTFGLKSLLQHAQFPLTPKILKYSGRPRLIVESFNKDYFKYIKVRYLHYNRTSTAAKIDIDLLKKIGSNNIWLDINFYHMRNNEYHLIPIGRGISVQKFIKEDSFSLGNSTKTFLTLPPGKHTILAPGGITTNSAKVNMFDVPMLGEFKILVTLKKDVMSLFSVAWMGSITKNTLMPMTPPLFTPDNLIVNASNTLLIAFGANGVFVFELPERTPPYGCFSNNKEIIYCRVHSLYEQTLAFSTRVEVRQVKFHPGTMNNTHVAFLTTNNILRVYNIQNGKAEPMGVYGVGALPKVNMPSAKISMMEALGETAVDFDFGPVEKCVEKEFEPSTNKNDALNRSLSALSINNKTAMKNLQNTFIIDSPQKIGESKKVIELSWPIYILYGNGDIFTMSLVLGDKSHPGLKGPHDIVPLPDEHYGGDYCSILCIPSTPPILAIANCRGRICHVVVLPKQEDENSADRSGSSDLPFLQRPIKTLLLLENIELELGLNTSDIAVDYSCPIILHLDNAKLGNYYATHETGVHSISVPCVDKLHKFVNTDADEEILIELTEENSTAEYLLCTKTSTAEKTNPVIGFTIYYDPHSLLVLLANGQFVSLAVVTMALPSNDYLTTEDMETMTSPLKKMLSNPFDVQIQRILKQSSTQPILKLSSGSESSQQECYELLQRAAQVFREEHFKHHEKAREAIEKRVKALQMLKKFQLIEIQRMTAEKQELQDKAENLAERYEDLKDKQEELIKRCEGLLKLIARKQTVPSHAENNFFKKMNEFKEKVEKYATAISKLRNKIKYQEVQMQNWQAQNQKNMGMGTVQSDAIKSNLQDTTNKIAEMVKEVNEYKVLLNIPY